MAVGEVAAVGEVEAEDGVAGGEQGHEGGGVGLRAGVGLDVGVLGAEELLGAIAGEGLDDVGEFTAAVVALAGVALGVLIGEDGAGGFQYSARDEVLRGDHLEAFVLAEHFVFDLLGDLRIGGGEGRVEVDGHTDDFMLASGFAFGGVRRLAVCDAVGVLSAWCREGQASRNGWNCALFRDTMRPPWARGVSVRVRFEARFA